MKRYHRAKAGLLRGFCPDFSASTLYDIEPEELKKMGIKAVLLDLDNTLVNWKATHVTDETDRWILQCKEAGLKLCLVSNTRNQKRLKELSARFEIPYARGKMKPSRTGFLDALRILECKPNETVMVGDQLFTDVWGGNRTGVATIWVSPRHPREFFGTKFSRIAERLVKRLLQKARAQ